ncbi:MAG: AMP-binding protein [Holosporales bacterium]|jgi:acetyl-CoA synthetase|nr:AMP-binding protein [Holosporales bacterium]
MLFHHKDAWSNERIYKEIYSNSIKYPNEFWKYHLKDLYWKKAPNSAFDVKTGKWLTGGISNVCYNCIDRHALNKPNKPAIIWHGDEAGERREISYSQLRKMVIIIASILKNKGIKKGDVIAIYMTTTPETIAAMLACARIGALHLVIFAGFSSEALAHRLSSSNTKLILTMTSSRRGGKQIEILQNVKIALSKMQNLLEFVLLDRVDEFPMQTNDEIEWQDNRDDLFILYTSGSSGSPKGIIHSALPYLFYAAVTFKIIFNIVPADVSFCTSDIGWITGHSYMAYAPLFYGLTTVIFEGNPTYPTTDRYWKIIEEEKVSILYSVPTAIRSLQMLDKVSIKKHDLSSLKTLGSVGEPINESAWKWYFEAVGNRRCPIMNTWWQTESGGIILAPLRDLDQKPCVTGKPFFGISIGISKKSNEFTNFVDEQGELAITGKWPGCCRNIEHEKMFLTGDGAIYDSDFDVKIIGRIDDVINISGHRFGTAEFESAINKVDEIKESAVVAVNHKVKGQAAFAYVVLKGLKDMGIVEKIIKSIREKIGPIARPDFIAFVPDLPKTRSGKITRHLLKDIANNKEYDSEDISSISNQELIPAIAEAAKNAIICSEVYSSPSE